MRTIKTCCCGCGDKPCGSEWSDEYRYAPSGADCPICALGITTTKIEGYEEFAPYEPTENQGDSEWDGRYPSTHGHPDNLHYGNLCWHHGVQGWEYYSLGCDDEWNPCWNKYPISLDHLKIIPEATFYQFDSPMGLLPWSPQAFKDWIDNWEGPLLPKGDCTMHCTLGDEGNLGCHKLAFVGALGKNFGSLDGVEDTIPLCGSDIITVPPPEDKWPEVREWVMGGGKLIVMGESSGSPQPGIACKDKLEFTNKDAQYYIDRCVDDDVANEMSSVGSMGGIEVAELLRDFALYCARQEEEEEIEEFFEFRDDEYYLSDRERNYINNFEAIGEDDGSSPLISCCQRTRIPFVKIEEDEKKPMSFHCSSSSGLIPKGKGKGLVGHCTGEGCTVVWKGNGSGAVVVVYDANTWGASQSQIPLSYWQNEAAHPDITLTAEELKLRACNNDFWRFMCDEFLGGEFPTTPCTAGDNYWDNMDPEKYKRENNPCLKTAACCLPNGDCKENMTVWECFGYEDGTGRKLPGIWHGSEDIHPSGVGSCGSECNDIDCTEQELGICCATIPIEYCTQGIVDVGLSCCLSEGWVKDATDEEDANLVYEYECCHAAAEQPEVGESYFWKSMDEQPGSTADTCDECFIMGVCCYDNSDDCQVERKIECEASPIGTPHDDINCEGNEDICVRPLGACCYGDNTCADMTRWDCEEVGDGVWLGAESECTTGNPCDYSGACCYVDGSCSNGYEYVCGEDEGIYQGDATDCNDLLEDCPVIIGVCCYGDDEDCQLCEEVITKANCDNMPGEWHPEGGCLDCNIEGCNIIGACCLVNGECEERTQLACEYDDPNNTYQGDDTECGDLLVDCPVIIGVCCSGDENDCQVCDEDVFDDDCDGTWTEGGDCTYCNFEGCGGACCKSVCENDEPCCVCVDVEDSTECTGDGAKFYVNDSCGNGTSTVGGEFCCGICCGGEDECLSDCANWSEHRCLIEPESEKYWFGCENCLCGAEGDCIGPPFDYVPCESLGVCCDPETETCSMSMGESGCSGGTGGTGGFVPGISCLEIDDTFCKFGACCVEEECSYTIKENCDGDGVWIAGENCDEEGVCKNHACCLEEGGEYECRELPLAACTDLEGESYEDYECGDDTWSEYICNPVKGVCCNFTPSDVGIDCPAEYPNTNCCNENMPFCVEEFCDIRGGSFHMDVGMECCEFCEDLNKGVCCVPCDPTCNVLTKDYCESDEINGIWLPPINEINTDCDTNPDDCAEMSHMQGACCTARPSWDGDDHPHCEGVTCFLGSQDECMTYAGHTCGSPENYWHGCGTDCGEVECMGACCNIEDMGQEWTSCFDYPNPLEAIVGECLGNTPYPHTPDPHWYWNETCDNLVDTGECPACRIHCESDSDCEGDGRDCVYCCSGVCMSSDHGDFGEESCKCNEPLDGWFGEGDICPSNKPYCCAKQAWDDTINPFSEAAECVEERCCNCSDVIGYTCNYCEQFEESWTTCCDGTCKDVESCCDPACDECQICTSDGGTPECKDVEYESACCYFDSGELNCEVLTCSGCKSETGECDGHGCWHQGTLLCGEEDDWGGADGLCNANIGACCTGSDAGCVDTTESACLDINEDGSVYMGDDSTCAEIEWGEFGCGDVGSCCDNYYGKCFSTYSWNCMGWGQEWWLTTDCTRDDGYTCADAELRQCCIAQSECELMLGEDCAAHFGGCWHPEAMNCNQNDNCNGCECAGHCTWTYFFPTGPYNSPTCYSNCEDCSLCCCGDLEGACNCIPFEAPNWGCGVGGDNCNDIDIVPGCCEFQYTDNEPNDQGEYETLDWWGKETYCDCVFKVYEFYGRNAFWDCGTMDVLLCGSSNYRSNSGGESRQPIDMSQEVRESGKIMGSRGTRTRTDCDATCILAGCDCNCINSENGIVCI